MTPPLLRRLVSAFCALWFAISVVEPALLHACPMHDTPAAVGGEGGHHAAHGAAADESPTSDQPQGAQCLCLGDCAAASAAGLASARIALVEIPAIATEDAGLPDHAYVPVARALLLPFANGPPPLPPSTRA